MKKAIADTIRDFTATKRVAVGFDGYIDRILRVKQYGAKDHHYIDTMERFGSYIVAKAGKSCSLELRLVEEKLGGNMPNYAHCLSRLGIEVDCVGAMGWPEIHPLFAQGLHNCRLYSVCQPGLSDALEFGDGKVLLAKNGEIETLNYDVVTRRLGPGKAAGLFARADMLTFLNWSELKGATSIWEGIGNELFPQISRRDTPMLVDFSDCSGKSREDILKIAQVLAGYGEKLRLYLSLNLNEAEQLALKLGQKPSGPVKLARLLLERFEPELLAIHLTDGCIYAGAAGEGFIPNNVIESPKILTGGGDNFNAGLSFGVLMGLDMKSALLLGNAVSGYYVSCGHSPDRAQLLSWLNQYHTMGEKKYENS